jgi:hypothetical protein
LRLFCSPSTHERTKLEPRSRLCCFIGYDIEHKGYRYYDPIAKHLCISHHVTFWEHRFFSGVESFPLSSFGASPIFTNVSFDLLPKPTNLDVGIISSSDDFLTGNSNLLDPPADPPTTFSKTHHSSPRHLTRVKTIPTHLRDYHCFFAIDSLHEPHSFRKALLTLFGRKLCLKNFMLSPKLTLGT